jgi:hypothetical protein
MHTARLAMILRLGVKASRAIAPVACLAGL